MKIFYQKFYYLIFIFGLSILPVPTKAVVVFKHDAAYSKNTPTTHVKKKGNRLTTFLLKAYLKKATQPNTGKTNKILRIILFSIIGILLIFALQGTIWLSILSGLSFLSLKWWQRIRYRNKDNDESNYTNQSNSSYSKRSVFSFLWGIGLWGFSILLPIGFPNAPAAIVGLFLVMVAAGFILFLISFVRALKGIQRDEPDKAKATIVLVLSLLIFLLLTIGLFAG